MVVLTLSQYLKDVAEDEFTIAAGEVESLVRRFGSRVRSIGQWNADGTMTLSRQSITEAAKGIAKESLAEAATALDPTQTLTELLDTSSATTIIERLASIKQMRLEELARELQETNDPERIEVLKEQLDRLIFPQSL